MPTLNHLSNLPATTTSPSPIALVRADLNIPFEQANVALHERFTSLLPTLRTLKQRGITVVLATHRGRPKPDDGPESFSTKVFVPALEAEDFATAFVPAIDPHAVRDLIRSQKPDIVLLENLRLMPGEKNKDATFAKNLAACADLYVAEAFATMHRADASVALAPSFFKPSHRFIGLQTQKELDTLAPLRTTPTHPFALVLGGGKPESKLDFLKQYLGRPGQMAPDSVLISGTLIQAFLQAKRCSIGSTKRMGQEIEDSAAQIITHCKQRSIALHLPTDIQIITGPIGSAPEICDITNIPAQALQIVDLGPASIAAYVATLKHVHTVFANGPIGICQYPAYATGTNKLLHAMAKVPVSVLGGGDSITAARTAGVFNAFSFVSTGGGATLAFLAANDPFNDLPGLKALVDYSNND